MPCGFYDDNPKVFHVKNTVIAYDTRDDWWVTTTTNCQVIAYRFVGFVHFRYSILIKILSTAVNIQFSSIEMHPKNLWIVLWIMSLKWFDPLATTTTIRWRIFMIISPDHKWKNVFFHFIFNLTWDSPLKFTLFFIIFSVNFKLECKQKLDYTYASIE